MDESSKKSAKTVSILFGCLRFDVFLCFDIHNFFYYFFNGYRYFDLNYFLNYPFNYFCLCLSGICLILTFYILYLDIHRLKFINFKSVLLSIFELKMHVYYAINRFKSHLLHYVLIISLGTFGRNKTFSC